MDDNNRLSMNSSVWFKLSPGGLAQPTSECSQMAHLISDEAVAELFRRGQVPMCARADGWFEFSLYELMAIFGPITLRMGGEALFEGNEIFIKRPY